MFLTLARKIQKDKDFPERTWKLDVLRHVLDGTIYDTLQYAFHDERTSGGEYVPLRDRRPCVRYNLCRLVVQDSIALLLGDGHFPTVEFASPDDRETMAAVIKESRLAEQMADAAHRGSVGSVAVLFRVLGGRAFFDVMDAGFLVPTYRPDAPDTLLRVTERYKVKGADLAAMGYTIAADKFAADFWFQRVWDDAAEIWYVPQLVAGEYRKNDFKSETVAAAPPVVDDSKTVRHDLGFVPMVWIRNLPGGAGIDGASTFAAAIETQIEIEYQLSQAGRGLKYSSDPTLLIKEPAADSGEIVRGAANALIVSKDGDARLLEINGTAATAVLEYVRALRESAIETIHGNRSSADKVSAAQSGRALEMMHQPLIWLADQLRTSYGENGILPLVRMVILASRKMAMSVRGVTIKPFAADAEPALRWPAWFAATGGDRAQEASALATLAGSGHISRETAVKSMAASFDIEDVQAELARIAADEVAAHERAKAAHVSVTATETLPA